MSLKSVYKDLRESDEISGVLVSRVMYIRKSNKKKSIMFEFKCGCGRLQTTIPSVFNRKNKKVCNSCSIKDGAKKKEKYVVNDKRLYAIWKNMNHRCDIQKGHHSYIKKGITVCWEWSELNADGFNNFVIDMYPRPTGLTLERVDNTKGYCKSNCRWATMKEQQNNRENNNTVVYQNVEWTVQQLSEFLNIKCNTLLYRLRRGWSIEEAVNGRRDVVYSRPYKDKLTDFAFMNMLYELIDLKRQHTLVAPKYGVSASHISRVLRDIDVLNYYQTERINYESLGQ